VNWEAIGAIGELVAAFAVLITLVYLAIQVRQAKSELHVSSLHEANKLMNDVSLARATSPELAKVLTRAAMQPAELEPWEESMIDGYFIACMNSWELALEQQSSGALGVERSELVSAFAEFLRQSWVPFAWKRNKANWPEHWEHFVGRLMADGDTNARQQLSE
jgi:hypothetical protein